MASIIAVSLVAALACAAAQPSAPGSASYGFDKTISREVLENYLARAITMEGLLNGRGDLDDNIRMLKSIRAKFVGRSLCLWGGEANLRANLERAKNQVPRVHAADPDTILQACIFEIVTTQVEQVPVPEWAFAALGQPVEKRNFRYADMLYPDGRFKDHWRASQSVPDVSRSETKLWFYFLGASFIDVGCEAIHLGQTELMNRNDRNLDHYAEVLALVRAHAAKQARRHMVLLDSHVPSGGLVREGQLLMDFHSFPLRIKEVPDKPQEAILELGFSDGIYGRSKGGRTFSGWECEHLPYLVEIDNWGVSKQPGQAKAGGIWIWGYDEITWFAHQSKEYRANWLRYAWDWVRRTDPNGFLQMPGSRTLVSPRDGKRWYYANSPSLTVPDGYGDEDAIRSIWASDVRLAPSTAISPISAMPSVSVAALGTPNGSADGKPSHATREITRDFLFDRIYGGWVGMLTGGLEGLPHEFNYKQQPRDTLREFSLLEDGGRCDDNDFEWTHLWFNVNQTPPSLPAECKVSDQAAIPMRVCERLILAQGGERFDRNGQSVYRVHLQAPRRIEAWRALVR